MAKDPRLGMQQTPDTKTIEGNVIRPDGVFEVISGDKERAAEFKKRTLEIMEPFLRLKDEAAKDGFLIVCWPTSPLILMADMRSSICI